MDRKLLQRGVIKQVPESVKSGMTLKEVDIMAEKCIVKLGMRFKELSYEIEKFIVHREYLNL